MNRIFRPWTHLIAACCLVFGVAASVDASQCSSVQITVSHNAGLEIHTFTDANGNPVTGLVSLKSAAPVVLEVFNTTWQVVAPGAQAPGTAARYADGSGAVVYADFDICDTEASRRRPLIVGEGWR